MIKTLVYAAAAILVEEKSNCKIAKQEYVTS